MKEDWKDAGLRENPYCRETYAIFILLGELLNHNEITERLKIKPSFIKKKEDTLLIESTRLIGQEEIWALSSKGEMSTTAIEQHLRFLLDQLEPVSREILEIVSQQSLISYFHCYWLPGGFLGGPVLTPQTIERIGNLNAYLDFGFRELYNY